MCIEACGLSFLTRRPVVFRTPVRECSWQRYHTLWHHSGVTSMGPCRSNAFVPRLTVRQRNVDLRFVRAFIAILLTASLVIAPAAVLPALASAGSHLAMTFQEAEESTGTATLSHEGQALDQASDADDHSAHHSGPHKSDPHKAASCCKLACHAFGLALGPVVFVPFASAPVLNVSADEQVTGTYLGRIDRPPRPL